MSSPDPTSARGNDLQADRGPAVDGPASVPSSAGVYALTHQDAAGDDPNNCHFATDHLLAGLKHRTISSGTTMIMAQATQFVLNLISTMILARLLTPQDFGLIAMATTVMGFVRVFKDAGLSMATVQRDGITHAQVSNLFWINVGVSALLCVIVAGSAPVVAWFFRDSRLVPITLSLAITLLLSGSTVQHMALLSRQMRFKATAFIQIVSMATGFTVGVGMALLGYGYWSLVGSSIATEVSAFLLTWSVSRWRPQFPKRRSGTISLVSFGANMTLSNFVYSIVKGSDCMLIGRVYGADALGLYSRALLLLTRPLDQLLQPLGLVFVPVLSRVQNDPARYRRAFLRVYEMIALVCFPFAGTLFAIAHPVTLVVLGRKWEQAATILACFTAFAICSPLSNAAFWLFTSQGRGREFLVTGLTNSALAFASYAVGIPFGPAGVALASSFCGLAIIMPLTYYRAGRQGPVTTIDLWNGFMRFLPLGIVTFTATYGVRMTVNNFDPLVQTLICLPAGLLSGVFSAWMFRFTRPALLGLVEHLPPAFTRRFGR